MPVMSYAFCPNLKKCLIFAIGEESRIFFICFLYKSGQTPGRCPPQITGLRVNSVTLRWVGAPNERAPFRVHDAIASFADRCLTRTRIARRPGFGWGFMNTEQLRLSCPGKFYTKMKNVRNLPCHSHSIEEANTTMSGNFMIIGYIDEGPNGLTHFRTEWYRYELQQYWAMATLPSTYIARHAG